LEGGNLATHVSAQKRARQSEKKRLRNAALKSLLKTSARKVLLAVEEKNVEEARKALARAVPAIQKIASKKVIHKKTAARKISRLARKVNTLTSPA
jgi:small subunit ribosomal protein S20